MSTEPRATPASFRIQTDEPTEPLRTPVDPVIPPAGGYARSLGHDAALPTGLSPRFSSTLLPFGEVTRSWGQAIADEQLIDLQIRHYRTPTKSAPQGLYLRSTDGALMRKPEGEALAYTERAWAQLISLLLQEVPGKPKGPNEPYRFLGPEVRSVVIEHLKARCRRKEGTGHELLLRTFIDPRFQTRALRAIVSGRHSGIHFDDLALIDVLRTLIAPEALAYCSRTIDATAGHAVMQQAGDVRATLNWSNSETGAASLEFGGGCYVAALDAVIRNGQTVKTDVTITSATDRTRRAHTLPRKNRSEAERAKIAAQRMTTDIASATASANELCAAWRIALQTFAAGWTRTAETYSRSMAAQVIIDLIEEQTGSFTGEDRKGLEAVLTHHDRLAALPFGSAAHIAGAWAVLAQAAPDYAEAKRLQDEAGRWVTTRFGARGQVIEPKAKAPEVLLSAMNH